MEEMLSSVIKRFVSESPLNSFPDGNARYFEEALIGFAAADDPLFSDYKAIIGPFHQTPGEIAAQSGYTAVTVICWVLPVSSHARGSNRGQDTMPSLEWAMVREQGENFNSALRSHVVSWLRDQGYHADAPVLMPAWKTVNDSPVGIASTWSERHAAYAAGLGTFSLSDGLITPAGIAHRIGSVITDRVLTPTPRTAPHYQHNCLYYRDGSCGVCVKRCPVGAISLESGHDKPTCREHVYGTIPATVGRQYGLTQLGCGLCQTKVPCENRIPKSGEGTSQE